MNQREFEQLVGRAFRDHVAAAAPISLRSSVARIPDLHPDLRHTRNWKAWRPPKMSRAVPIGLAAAAAVVAIAIGIGLVTRHANVGHETPLPSAVATTTPAARPASWRETGSMITARDNSTPLTKFTATLLLDGRALVTGGYQLDALARAEPYVAQLYEPRSGRWTVTGNLITPRRRQSVTLLGDGRVLVAGGLGPYLGRSAEATLRSAEVYDPATGRWTATGSMHTAREGHLAVELLDGRVLVIGGTSGSSAEVYDPSSGTWTQTGAPTGHPTASDTATVLTNGDVLLVGYEFSAQIYHPSSGSWETTGQMIQRRSHHSATVLADGRVLVAGGWIGGPVISSAEIYDPNVATWTATGSMLHQAEPNASMLLSDGSVLVVTGNSAERYDPTTGRWRAAAGMPPGGRGGTAVLLADGTVLIAGGENQDGRASTSAYVYDPGTGN